MRRSTLQLNLINFIVVFSITRTPSCKLLAAHWNLVFHCQFISTYLLYFWLVAAQNRQLANTEILKIIVVRVKPNFSPMVSTNGKGNFISWNNQEFPLTLIVVIYVKTSTILRYLLFRNSIIKKLHLHKYYHICFRSKNKLFCSQGHAHSFWEVIINPNWQRMFMHSPWPAEIFFT